MSARKSSAAKAARRDELRREALRQQQAAEVAEQRRRRLIGIGMAVAAIVLTTVLATVWLTRDKPADLTAATTPPHANADNSGIVVNPGTSKVGVPVVALYVDYQCPNCKELESNIGANLLSLADKGDITLEYRTMTFMDTNLRNSASTRAAVGAACADWAGVYAKYHDAVFARQAAEEVQGSEGYSDALLRDEIPEQLGVGGAKLTSYQQCYDQRTSEAFVQTTDDAAGAAGVTGTPTIHVNGKSLEWLDQSTNAFLPWASGGQSDATVLAAITAAG